MDTEVENANTRERERNNKSAYLYAILTESQAWLVSAPFNMLLNSPLNHW